MKICIPLKSNQGLNSPVNAHFGSAPYFLIYDTTDETFEVINNQYQRHIHGMCHPLKSLENQNINAVVCKGMGARAVQRLNNSGIKTYRVSAETVETIIKKYKKGALEEITIENACIDHARH